MLSIVIIIVISATLCYLLHAEKENSVKNLHCLAANISLEKRLQELTSRKNLELESHRQFVVIINLVLATPATSMAPDRVVSPNHLYVAIKSEMN